MAKKLIYSSTRYKEKIDFYIDEQGTITKQVTYNLPDDWSVNRELRITKEIIALIKGNWLERISPSEFEPEITWEFAEALKITKSLKQILLMSKFSFDENIIKAISNNTSLNKIRFFVCSSEDTGIKNIIKALQNNKTVRTIIFYTDEYFYEDVSEIMNVQNFFKYNTTITKTSIWIGDFDITTTKEIENYLIRNNKILDNVVTIIKKYFYNNDKDLSPENFDLLDSSALRSVNLVNKNTLKECLTNGIFPTPDEESITNAIDKAVKYYKDHYFFYNALRKSPEFNIESLFNLLANELIDKIIIYLIAGNLSESIKMSRNYTNQEHKHNSEDISVKTTPSEEITLLGIDSIDENF